MNCFNPGLPHTFMLVIIFSYFRAVYDHTPSPLPEYSLNDSIYSGSTAGLVREAGGTSTLTQDAQFTNPLYELEKDGR